MATTRPIVRSSSPTAGPRRSTASVPWELPWPVMGASTSGTGTASFTQAFQLDAAGRSHYDLKSELGTILRVAPDFQSRSIVATGIRYPVALRFNREGDLFATDQEGATWLPNGNPFDELLQIQQGRHYGFPPRHSRHLPGVIDEPSVFDYKPQHQSTCGLNFNESVLGGPVFGPSSWAGRRPGQRLLAGQALPHQARQDRGRLRRPDGRSGRLEQADGRRRVSPAGALAVATHSGGPDWGSGPTGQGTLYKITYAQRDQPQPVLAWAESPREVRVAFDRPLDPAPLRDLAAARPRARPFGVGRRSVRDAPARLCGGDGPAWRPAEVPDGPLRPDVAGSADADPGDRPSGRRRDAMRSTLPGLGRPPRGANEAAELPQEPAVDLAYGLTGVAAEWRTDSGTLLWKGWLPHLDLAVARAFTAGMRHARTALVAARPARLSDGSRRAWI